MKIIICRTDSVVSSNHPPPPSQKKENKTPPYNGKSPAIERHQTKKDRFVIML